MGILLSTTCCHLSGSFVTPFSKNFFRRTISLPTKTSAVECTQMAVLARATRACLRKGRFGAVCSPKRATTEGGIEGENADGEGEGFAAESSR